MGRKFYAPGVASAAGHEKSPYKAGFGVGVDEEPSGLGRQRRLGRWRLQRAMLFSGQVDVTALGQHVDRDGRKDDETNDDFPHGVWLPSIRGVDVHVLGFLHEQHANDEGEGGDHDGIPHAVVHVLSLMRI